jgi:hypothetical protein
MDAYADVVAAMMTDFDPNSLVCEWCGLYRTQPSGAIEPGRHIAGDWWCAGCLEELRAVKWHEDMEHYNAMWDQYPDLMATIGA